MKYEIKSRWDGRVLFEAEIACDVDASEGVKIGLAVRAAWRRGADLSGAFLIGADLSGAVLSGADLSGAVLSDAVLIGADLSGAVLSDADLRGAFLSGADLSGAVLSDADLRGADLSGADLSGADLRGAFLSGAPVIENIHQKVYAAASAPGALDMSVWHNSCGTAHCRAGWVVTLAGEEGKQLEKKMGTPAAATLIYLKSDPNLDRVPNFYCIDEPALEDMKRRAEEEAAKVSS